jgi:hypothetical protein
MTAAQGSSRGQRRAPRRCELSSARLSTSMHGNHHTLRRGKQRTRQSQMVAPFRMHFRAKLDPGVREASSADGSNRQLLRERFLKLGVNLIGRLDMWRPKSAPIAITALLALIFVLCPQNPANAAKFCAQLRGSTAAGQPDCSFSTLDACRARVRHRGGGHCYKLTH